jgi:hypothetical protein
MKQTETHAQAKRRLTKLLTSQSEVHCIDQKAYVTMLLLGLELAQKGKTVANIHGPSK